MRLHPSIDCMWVSPAQASNHFVVLSGAIRSMGRPTALEVAGKDNGGQCIDRRIQNSHVRSAVNSTATLNGLDFSREIARYLEPNFLFANLRLGPDFHRRLPFLKDALASIDTKLGIREHKGQPRSRFHPLSVSRTV
ncbi:protein of unknown function [Hyphomicrobium sp. MC1]|nr:protein of unknown function [Hyphomicrobium sp. MC1]